MDEFGNLLFEIDGEKLGMGVSADSSEENQFLKALQGLLGVFGDIKEFFWDNQNQRFDKMWKEWENPSFNALLSTLDALTYGIPSGFWSAHTQRTNRMMNSEWVLYDENGNFTLTENPIYNFVNTLLAGMPDMVTGAVFPEEQFSSKHWEDMFGTALLLTLVTQTAMKPAADVTNGAGSKVLSSVDDIVSNPKSLFGKSKADVAKILGEGWTEGAYGSSKTGWKFTKGDQSIFYHPGGGRHGGSYYGYSSGATGKIKIVGPDYVPLPGDKATIIVVGD